MVTKHDERERFELRKHGGLRLALQVQRCATEPPLADVIYVHGATFGADLSVFFRFDGRSWADELSAVGFTVWGFDFTGYGSSERYPDAADEPVGTIGDAVRQLRRIVLGVRQRNGNRPVVLLAHSRGGAVAARYAGDQPQDVAALVLFAPIVMRPANVVAAAAPDQPSQYPLSVWAQYRRFTEDAPRGCAPLIADAHMQAWAGAFLASDPTAASRLPASVMTPSGPLVDVRALWSGEALYDPTHILAPTLLVRGQWDSACTDDDAVHLMAALQVADKTDVVIAQATHLMHLERQRGALHDEVNRFLLRVAR
jgi:alpha-beta hydrolase superfamily lysophospholipase